MAPKGDHAMHKNVLLTGLALLASLTTSPAHALDGSEPILQPCFECHGRNGVSVKPEIPNINGQLERYLVRALKKLRSGERPSQDKPKQLKGMPDKDIAAIAQYFSRQNNEQPLQPFDGPKAAIGLQLHEEHCEACHNRNGRESSHFAPFLAGQRLDYLLTQTRAFMRGERPVPYMMDDSVKDLAVEDLEHLSHFYASQPRVVRPPY